MFVATETPSTVAMLAGLEGLIAAMKNRRPKLRASKPRSETPAAARASDTGDDDIVTTQWHAMQPPSPTPTTRSGRIARGSSMGRYVVLRRLGAGGMGVVYAAYDPELDRKVALKLLLPGRAGRSRRTRLLREAQALAKLNNPNVVAVHDVGTMGDQVWLAMEFVHGQTLGRWMKTAHSWREVLKVFQSAGAGLAAAHAAGLLHRDFKPDNVMVGDDGRVRVMDFGLARTRPDTAPLRVAESQAVPVIDTLAMEVTQKGAILGTPSYMAPEQFEGAAVTAAADQFAFCTTLWEALYRERPPMGGIPRSYVTTGLRARLRASVRHRAAPRWLRRACERGLAVEPEQRWPSMDALLDTLAKGRARARVRKVLAAVGVLAMLAAYVGLVLV